MSDLETGIRAVEIVQTRTPLEIVNGWQAGEEAILRRDYAEMEKCYKPPKFRDYVESKTMKKQRSPLEIIMGWSAGEETILRHHHIENYHTYCTHEKNNWYVRPVPEEFPEYLKYMKKK
jgi:hypothetical protein